MKKLLIFILAICLILFSGIATLGAIHNHNGDFINWGKGKLFLVYTEIDIFTGNATDTWYSITPDKNVFKANVSSADKFTSLEGEYIFNDQTFVGASTLDFSDGPFDRLTDIYGGYLFDFGLFIGLENYIIESLGDTNVYIISPGYRFNINEQTYLAASFDYGINSDEDFSEIVGYDLDYAYYGKTAKFYAQYYSGTEDGIDGDAYSLGAAFQVKEDIVIGFNYFHVKDDSGYDAGLTWKPNFMTLDLKLGALEEESSYALNGLFNITDKISAGLEYFAFDPIKDNRITIKLKYEDQSSKLIFGYVLENDSYEAAYNLGYTYSFK